MHGVVNHLPIMDDADWPEIARKFGAFAAKTRRDFPKMKVAVLLRAGDSEAIFVGLYEDRDTLQHVSQNIAAPWFAENIRPLLAGPATRSVGEVIAGSV